MNLSDPTNFRDLLSHDHARLDAMLATVLELTHSDVQPSLDDQWTLHEENLLSHLDAEDAKTEEQPLYLWADTAVPETSFGLVVRRLRATWQRIRSSATPLEERQDGAA